MNVPCSVQPDPGEEPVIIKPFHEVEHDLEQWDIGFITHEEDWLFDISKLDSAKVNTAYTLDEMLDLFPYDQLMNKDEFCPEQHGLPPLPPEDHEHELMFHPDMQHAALTLATRACQRFHYPTVDPKTLKRFLAWRPVEIITKTLEHTTQMAKSFLRHPLRRHFKARNPFSNVMRMNETFSTYPVFANCLSLFHRWLCAQIFYGLKSHHIDVYGLKTKAERSCCNQQETFHQR